MATPQTRTKTSQSPTTNYETQLWQMADALRGSMDAAEDRDEYIAENIFWVPPEARWPKLQSQAQRLDAEIETNLERLGFGYNEPV